MVQSLVRRITLATAVATAVVPAGLAAQPLPEARAVLARYARATNAARIATFPAHRFKGTFSLPSQGLVGPVVSYGDRLGRSSQVLTIANIGDLREGVDTAFAWSIDPLQGPKVIEGREFIEAREREDLRAMVRDPALVVGAETLERATIDSQPCVKVRLTWKSGRVTTECYSEQTGLLVWAEGVQSSSMGELKYTTSYSEYKAFDGVTLPTKSVQRAAGTEATTIITEVEFGALDPAWLAIPPEIQALRKR